MSAIFGAFGTTGDVTTRKRELAAFFGQTSQETTGCLLSFSTIEVVLTVKDLTRCFN